MPRQFKQNKSMVKEDLYFRVSWKAVSSDHQIIHSVMKGRHVINMVHIEIKIAAWVFERFVFLNSRNLRVVYVKLREVLD